MRIERVAEPGAEWDAFVESTPGATLGHASAWARVLTASYRLEPHYLAALDASGAWRGVLPLVRFRTIRGSLELVSLPFLDTGGILARDGDAERALLAAGLELARRTGSSALELRQPAPLAGVAAPGPARRVDLVLELAKDEEAQWSALPAKVRNQTRKAGREGLRLAPDGPDLLAAFYRPFCENMRDLGSPVHGQAFFREAASAFGERLRFVVVCDGARPLGGLVAIHFAGSVSVPWASTLRSERARCPNNLIYWEALRWAVARGARELDFGRSPPESGTYQFKRGWGARERPLFWTRLGPDGSAAAAGSSEPGRLLRALSGLWQRLPLPASAWIGPRLRRYFSN